jgi:soluble lytic murein transglycosylase-like protein
VAALVLLTLSGQVHADAPGRAKGRIKGREVALLELLQRAMQRNGIAADELPVFLAFIHVESRFAPDQVSVMGAVGLFQLMPGTAAAIAAEHPDFAGHPLRLFNPEVKPGRLLLHAGPRARYRPSALRWYAKRLRRFKQHAPPGALPVTDQRFDPYTSALLGTFYIRKLEKTFFNRYRCYRKGKAKLCGTFRGQHAALLAAACFHLGPGRVLDQIATSKSRTIKAYIDSARRSKDRSFRRNARYLTKLVVTTRRYARLVKRKRLNREGVTQALGEEIARGLFARYPTPRP